MVLDVELRRLRFRAPIVTAYATYEQRELLLVRVTDADGLTALGEAAPLEPFDGVSLDAVRAEAGPSMAIRVDANGAWSPEEAVAALRALAPARLELCEEPTRGVLGIRTVRAALAGAVAVALDESAREPGALTAGGAD